PFGHRGRSGHHGPGFEMIHVRQTPRPHVIDEENGIKAQTVRQLRPLLDDGERQTDLRHEHTEFDWAHNPSCGGATCMTPSTGVSTAKHRSAALDHTRCAKRRPWARLTRSAAFRLLRRERNPSVRKRVAVVGATGIAGQQFLAALNNHPWFEVTALAASAR